MLTTLTAALLFGAARPPDAPTADTNAPPAQLQLFADESWYKQQKGDEKDFIGLLSKTAAAPGDPVGVGRANPYRLTMTDDKGKQTEREVYVGAHPDLLASYVGRNIKLIGKAVDAEVAGKPHAEIWPARLELRDAPPPPEPLKEAPDRLDLLVNNDVYRADTTPEKDYVGVLEKKKGENAVGYRLVIDSGEHIDRQDLHLYEPHYSLFDPYAGLRVKITGKKTSGQIQGVAVSYILAGRLEVVPADGAKTVRELKVLARTEWKPGEGVAPVQLVIRGPKELALAHGQPADKADDDVLQTREADLAAQAFHVEKIDWKRQMIVVASPGAEPTGGYSVEITGLAAQDDLLTVHWRVNAPKPGDLVKQEISHPAQAVLTERVEGKSVFDPAPKAAAPGK